MVKHDAKNTVIIQNCSHIFLFLNVGCHICNVDQDASHPYSFMITYGHKKMTPQRIRLSLKCTYCITLEQGWEGVHRTAAQAVPNMNFVQKTYEMKTAQVNY